MDPVRISLPLAEFGSPEIVTFDNFPFSDGKDHFALVFKSSGVPPLVPLVRVHSECITGDLLGLHEKIKSYALQDEGLDTFEANVKLGHLEDKRSYVIAADMLKVLGVSAIRLLTRNPEKARQLALSGIHVVEQISTRRYLTEHNDRYLRAKEKLGNNLK
jgi:GTP cyclohydrolase II